MRRALITMMFLISGAFLTTSQAYAAPSKTAMAGVVNINTASTIELMQLPGIGFQRAEQIAEYRNKRPFKKPTDLMRINGIGRKMYDKIANHLTVTEPTKLTIIRQTAN